MTKNKIKTFALLTTLLVSMMPLLGSMGASTDYGIVSEAELSYSGDGSAGWCSTTAHSGGWSINLTAPGKASWDGVLEKGVGVNEGRVTIELDEGATLGDIENITWWVKTVTGYPPHVDLLLDIDGDGDFDPEKDLVTGEIIGGPDDAIVAEFAYQPYVGTGYWYNASSDPYGHYDPDLNEIFYDPAYGVWLETFQNDTLEAMTAHFDNGTVCWLYSGLPGPYPGGYFGKLEDFKEGTVQVINGSDVAPVDNDTRVLAIQIEVDNWLGASEAYVDDIAVNGEVLISKPHPTLSLVNPEHVTYEPGDIPVEILASDIFGIAEVMYNVKDSIGDWLYTSNQTYTGATDIEDLPVGEYTCHAWATNTLGYTSSVERSFSVRVSEIAVEIHPKTLNLKSGGRWVTVVVLIPEGYETDEEDWSSVELKINGVTLEAVWGVVEDGRLMVKFDRAELVEKLEEGEEVVIEVTGEIGTVLFQDSDTIRVINPGNNSHSHGNGKQNGPKITANENKGNNGNTGNNGKSTKNNKGGKK